MRKWIRYKTKPDIIISFILKHEYEQGSVISYRFKVDTSFYNKKGYLSEAEIELIGMYALPLISTIKYYIDYKISCGKTYIPSANHSCYDFYFSSEWYQNKIDDYIIKKLSNIPYELNSKYKISYPQDKVIGIH